MQFIVAFRPQALASHPEGEKVFAALGPLANLGWIYGAGVAGVALLLVVVIVSYRQTVREYPQGGGSYIVARQNLGLLPGPGSEAGESREYRVGDEVRRMDWPVTARTTVPHVRQTIADRELETWLAVDLSASLDFGTANCLKRDLAVAATAAIGHLTVRGGNRIGAVVGTGEAVRRIPPRSGRRGAQALLRAVATTPAATAAVAIRRARRRAARANTGAGRPGTTT